MAINKVEYNNNGTLETLIDLTSDTVTADTLLQGYTAHNASGEVITGGCPSAESYLADIINKNITTYTNPPDTSLVFPEMFLNNYGLTTVTLTAPGENTFYIGNRAFSYCRNLDITINANACSVGEGAFLGNYSLPQISGTVHTWILGDFAFYECQQLTGVFNVDHIGQSAFYNCFNVTEVNILSAYDIPYNCFYGCESLTTVTIPDGVEIFRDYAFFNCNNLSITLPPNLVWLSANCCAGIANTTLTIPATVKEIDSLAFQSCANLTTVTFEGTPTTMYAASSGKKSIFYNCNALTDIYVPWAEGAVANAPWGATNATIHYNTTT